jgi:3-oxoacyl-[acyl-carrier protein] reductase
VQTPFERDTLLSYVPLARIGQPEDIANAVAFLASDSAAYIMGQLILVDCGRTYQ